MSHRRALFFALLAAGSVVVTPPPSGPQRPIYPPAGFVGVVGPDVLAGKVHSPWNDPVREYLPNATDAYWPMSSYGRGIPPGMRYKQYGTPQDGTVKYRVNVWCCLDSVVQFYILSDDSDAANFKIVENGQVLGSAISANGAANSQTPVVGLAVSLTQGLHVLEFQVFEGKSIYVSQLEVHT